MRKWNKLLSLLLAMIMAFSLAATGLADGEEGEAGAQTPTADESTQTGNIVILHTNDVHGKYAGDIGYAGLAAYKDEMAKTNYVTLVDAGDFSQGEAIAILSKGEYLVSIMNEVGYDLAVPGNHEFDYGMEQALKNLNALDATVVSCNFTSTKDGESTPVFDAYKIIEYGNKKVAYVGMSTPDTYTKSTPTYFQDENGEYIYSFNENELYTVVQGAVDTARAAGADYVVAVGHMGIDEQSSPWTSREVIANTTGIDVFIDGHSHSKIENETVANKDGKNVVLAQTGDKLGSIGKVTIAADGAITAELVSEYEGKDEAVSAKIAEIEASYSEITSQVVAESAVKLIAKNEDDSWAVRNGETNMGDLITDAYRTVMGADIGIMNGGGIRANINAGEVTMGDILAVMTFGNMATVIEATGQQILDCLEMGASAYPGASGGFTHVSGLTYTINAEIPSTVVKDEKGNFSSVSGEYRVRDVKVGEEALDLEKTYTVACHSYWLTSYGDGMTMFAGAKVVPEKHEMYVDNVMLSMYIRENLGGKIGEEYAEPAGRITIIEAEAPAEPTEPATPAEPSAAAFSDVAESNWHYEFVTAMVDAGVVSGYPDGTFLPSNSVKWGEALKMVLSYAKYDEPAKVEGGTWASGWIALAKSEGIIDKDVEQNAVITRVEMCELVAKTLKIAASEAESAFADVDNGYVTALVELKVIEGMPDGTFDPDGELTRAQLCKILFTAPEAPAKEAPAEGEAPAAGEAPAEGENTPTEGEDTPKAA